MSRWVAGRLGIKEMLLLLAAGWMAVLLPGAIETAGLAQSAAAVSPTFEVATIKPSDGNAHGGTIGISGDHFKSSNQTLRTVLKFAYGANFGSDDQISGGPNWMDSARFDIDAKEEGPVFAEMQQLPGGQQLDRVRLMVQALLADRFKLTFHRETRTITVYALTVAKNGPKLKTSIDGAATADGVEAPGPESWRGIRGTGRGELAGKQATPEMLANVLGMQPEIGGRVVIDRTGLTGKYDFTLQWTPELSVGRGFNGQRPNNPGGVAQDASSQDSSGPSIFTALQEQLGLGLETAKGPVDVIVIDHVEMPSEN